MFSRIRSIPFTLAVLFAPGLSLPASAQLYDLAADWSDSSNPNGAWSYGILSGSTFTPFAIHTDTYINVGPSAFSGNQPAWTRTVDTGANGSPEGLAKSVGNSSMDFPTGRVGGHTPVGSEHLAVRWTAPRAGTLDVSGGTWMWRDIDRTESLSLFVNGSAHFDDVLIPERDQGVHSGSTFTLSQAIVADGGNASDLLGITVDAGDTVILAARQASTADFVGLDMQVQFAPVPAPGALATMLIGAVPGAALLLLRRRK